MRRSPHRGTRRSPHTAIVAVTLAAGALVLGCSGGEPSGDGAGGEDAGEAAARAAYEGASPSDSWPADDRPPEYVRGPGEPLDSATAAELAEVRRAVARYRTPQGALQDGYLLFSASPDGDRVAYVDEAAVAGDGSSALDGALDRTRPEILLYTMGGGEGGGGTEDGAAERQGGAADSGAGGGPGPAGWRLAAVEYALPKEEAGTTRPDEALDLFSGVRPGDWRQHPTREELGMNVKWTGYGDCHYEGGAVITLAGGPGHTYLRLPPGAVTGESWDGPPVTADACAATYQGQDLLMAHGKLWMLRAWIGLGNPEGVFRASNPRTSD